jgi:23S rRNA (cytidine1920-2'-O)/16S rRNA (cytidine1409-2'-O)-methyltransferase
MRADVLLVQRGLAPSRALAQRMIEAGHVYVREGAQRVAIGKPSASVGENVEVEVANNELERYVSRGGLKLEGALEHIALTVEGFHCLDVGQSTGGFTDCLLQRGVAHVVGVDVGHDQLHAKLRADSRVTCIESVNARKLNAETVGAALPRSTATTPTSDAVSEAVSRHSRSYKLFDLIVADVSFISLTKVLPQWSALLEAHGRVLSLVKPQFEVGADNLGKGGIVRDESLYPAVEMTIRDACVRAKFDVIDYFASSIVGGDGNREFFVYAKHMGAQ